MTVKSFFIVFYFMFGFNLVAQNCDKLLEWTDIVKQEFPERNLDKYEFKFVKRVAFNLFSDTYFVPYFKKPFDEISQIQLNTIKKRFEKCKGKGTITWQANQSLLSYFRNNLGHTVQYVEEARQLKKEFETFKKDIIESDLSKINVVERLKILDKKYAIFFPSVIEPLRSTLEVEKQRRESKQRNDRRELFMSALNNSFTLDEIIKAKSANVSFLSSLNYEEQVQVSEIITRRTKEVLNVELENFSKIQQEKKYSGYQDIKVIDKESGLFFKKYFDYRLGVKSFEKVLSIFKMQHLELLLANEDEIVKRIGMSRTKDQLKYISTEYLEFEKKGKYTYYHYFQNTLDKRKYLEFKNRLLKEIVKRKNELGL